MFIANMFKRSKAIVPHELLAEFFRQFLQICYFYANPEKSNSVVLPAVISQRIIEHLERCLCTGFFRTCHLSDYCRTVCEISLPFRLLFIDMEKTFDSVNTECVWNTLR